MKSVYMAEDIVGFKTYIIAEDMAQAWTKWSRYLSHKYGWTIPIAEVQNQTVTLIKLKETVITGVFSREG